MKIAKAETSIVEIPFQLRGSGVGITPTAWKSLEFALVRLEDEQGNVGWGEGFGYFSECDQGDHRPTHSAHPCRLDNR